MKGDCDDYVARDKIRRSRTAESTQAKVNALLATLLKKEEELLMYKNRLKELQSAFYYNLKLISERDIELGNLEKQVAAGNEELKEVTRERNELEELIKTIDEKNGKKVHQLEKKLVQREEEIQDLRRENLNNIGTLKRIIDDVKTQQEKKLNKISAKFECQKNELMKGYRDQIEEKEKYYLLEIDSLAGKLEQARREKNKLAVAEKEIRKLKCQLEDVEHLFLEKEMRYLEEIKRMNRPCGRKANKEIQCVYRGPVQQKEKIVQVKPEIAAADSQTCPQEEDFLEKVKFLQEQNEVLKFIIKDLKRTREGGGQPPGCECLTLREDVEVVKRKMESEMSNLREILEEEMRGKEEEEAVIGSLETSVRCLKEKLLSGVEERGQQVTGKCLRNKTCFSDTQVALLEQKLCQKLDSLMRATENERQKVHQKLEELKKETIERMDRYLEGSQESRDRYEGRRPRLEDPAGEQTRKRNEKRPQQQLGEQQVQQERCRGPKKREHRGRQLKGRPYGGG